jgi:hypothetical protein
MPYTTEEGGIMNNFANEPKVYQAEPPSNKEKRNYLILGALALMLVGGLITITIYASNVNAG